MSVWRYTAVEVTDAARRHRRGELTGETAAEVRASLRRIGLQVVELKPLRASRTADATRTPRRGASLVAAGRTALDRHLRRRRREERAELYDSIATMLAAGVPLLEAIDTVIASSRGRRSRLRLMLVALRQALRSGASLAQAMAAHRAWFDGAEVAMVRAGQHGGTLPEVLRSLSDRQQRAGELSQRLIGALAYPAIVAAVGVIVVIFLSVKVLPNLAGVLGDLQIEVPRLTRAVMAVGGVLALRWWVVVLVAVGMFALAAASSRFLARYDLSNRLASRLTPRVVRRIAVARVAIQLAELLRTGVPVVDALRVLAPTVTGLAGGLRASLESAADEVERGAELSDALADPRYFDAEFRRLLDIGQTSGDLDDMLERLGHRYARAADRLIDRLATLLEPAVILLLAALVGLVVMAAVLPLLRLQEIL